MMITSLYLHLRFQLYLAVEPNLRKQNDIAIYNYLVFNRTDYDETTFFEEDKKIKTRLTILKLTQS